VKKPAKTPLVLRYARRMMRKQGYLIVGVNRCFLKQGYLEKEGDRDIVWSNGILPAPFCIRIIGNARAADWNEQLRFLCPRRKNLSSWMAIPGYAYRKAVLEQQSDFKAAGARG
jgi:hypothetical protein